MFKTIIEPFRIKTVEQIKMTTPEQRQEMIRAAGYNIFALRSEDVIIDLLTDSGTGAMSSNQWGGVMRGDESYAGSPSFFHFRDSVHDITGFEYIIPTHQGRAAERILFSVMCKPGDVVPNNSHFDTTRANCEFTGAVALDLPSPELADMESDYPFKGDMDVDAPARDVRRVRRREHPARDDHGHQQLRRRPAGLARRTCTRSPRSAASTTRRSTSTRAASPRTPTSSSSASRVRATAASARSCKEMCDLAQGCTMSAKKDAIVNIGGFLATRDPELARQHKDLLILTEGFPTYGGLSGRDLEALAIGMQEAVDEDYLHYRIMSTRYIGEHLRDAGVPILWPPGGHAIYLDARRFASHLAPVAAARASRSRSRCTSWAACARARSARSCSATSTPRPARRSPARASSCASRSRAAPTRRATWTT